MDVGGPYSHQAAKAGLIFLSGVSNRMMHGLGEPSDPRLFPDGVPCPCLSLSITAHTATGWRASEYLLIFSTFLSFLISTGMLEPISRLDFPITGVRKIIFNLHSHF